MRAVTFFDSPDTFLNLESPTKVQLGQNTFLFFLHAASILEHLWIAICCSCDVPLQGTHNQTHHWELNHCDSFQIPWQRTPSPLWGAFQMGARFFLLKPHLWLFISSLFLQSSKPPNAMCMQICGCQSTGTHSIAEAQFCFVALTPGQDGNQTTGEGLRTTYEIMGWSWTWMAAWSLPSIILSLLPFKEGKKGRGGGSIVLSNHIPAQHPPVAPGSTPVVQSCGSN